MAALRLKGRRGLREELAAWGPVLKPDPVSRDQLHISKLECIALERDESSKDIREL